MALTGKQNRHLRALGHHLDPVVQIGKNGITEAVIAQLAAAIDHHELVKVKLLTECPVDRTEAGEQLASALGAELTQTLGRTLLFWKRNPHKPKVELPGAKARRAPVTAPSRARTERSAGAEARPTSRPRPRSPGRAR
jgi:RNA-binding protein